jgi:hypothetical protein
MSTRLRRLGRSLTELVAEDRDGFKRLDASSAPLYDDGSWLKPRR